MRGEVVYGGRPTPGAMVILHPLDDTRAALSIKPHAPVGADGKFAVNTYAVGDGAPPGRYALTVTWHKRIDEDTRGPNLLPARYGDPRTSGLRVEVKDGPIDLPAFRLERR